MTDKPLVRAFVSSTYVDLKEHRARVIATLRRSGLHVDPMEDWTADDREPKAFSQQRVDGCHLCILLVAFRRGYVPDGETLSITQMEYEHALKSGIAVLPFLLGDEEPWPRRFDELDKEPGIRAWREELQKRHGCGTFRLQPESLDVGPAVTRWIQERATHAVHASPVIAQPFDFGPYLEAKRQDFVGREWLFDEIDQWRRGRRERSLLIVGDPGIGKSAIVAELVHRNPGGAVLAHHCCRADDHATLQPGLFVRGLAAQVARKLPAYAARLADAAVAAALDEANCATYPVKAYEDGLLTPLSRLPAPDMGTCSVVIDALAEALAGDAVRGLNLVDLLAARLEQLPPWLRLVATTRREGPVLDRLRGLRACSLDAQDPRNRGDIREYIRQRLAEESLAGRLRDRGTTAAAVERLLVSRSEGNFLYVRQALDAVGDEADPLACLERLPPGLYGLYQHFFSRHFPDESRYEKPKRVLQAVVAAQEPLTERQLAAVTGLDDEEELPAVLRGLSAYLPVRKGTGGEERRSVYHKSLTDWLSDPELRGSMYYASPRRGHRRLADWCLAEYRRGPRRMDRYALRHLPAHLGAVECWDEAADLLTDLFYLEARAEAGQVFELVGDFSRLVAVLPRDYPRRRLLGLSEEGLRLDIQFLARHPATLFQCLWNRGWWYDCPQAAGHYVAPPGPAGEPLPWEETGPRLSELLEEWRRRKEAAVPGFPWLRSLRPPAEHLGTALQQVFQGHEGAVNSIALSPDGRLLASGSGDKTVRVWDAASGQQLRRLEGHTREVLSVSFSPDGNCLASGADDETVRIWDAASGQELRRLEGHTREVWSVSFSPDGGRLASGSGDKTVRVWDVVSGQELRRLEGHSGSVRGVFFSPDGGRLASGSGDNTIRIWDAASGQELHRLEGHPDWVGSVSFSPDGARLASGSDDRTVRIWDAASGQEMCRLEGHSDWVGSVSFSPDGARLASGSDDRTVRIWDAASGQELRRLEGHSGSVRSVFFSPDGSRLASGSDDRTVRVWDAASGQQMRRLQGHTGLVNSVSFNPNGDRLTSGSHDRTVRIWDVVSGRELRRLEGHMSTVWGVSFSPDGGRLASGSGDNSVQVWDAASGQELRRLQGHTARVLSVSFSPDGGRLASGSRDRTVRVWKVASGQELRRLEGHTGGVGSVSFSPDGNRLASGSDDETVRVWDEAYGQTLSRLEGHTRSVRSVSFSPDGGRLASASDDQTVRVWVAASGECLEIIQGQSDTAAMAAGLPDYPWQAIVRGLETLVVRTSSAESVAWLPLAPRWIITHPGGRTWAGGIHDYVYLFTLEGTCRV